VNFSPRDMINQSFNTINPYSKGRENAPFIRTSPISQNFSDQGKVNKNLRDDFEGVKQKGSLAQSVSHGRDLYKEGDISRDSFVSHVKSCLSSSNQTNIYKQKFRALEKKYQNQKILLVINV